MAEQSCELLGGVFSLLVQFFLAIICILTLVYKRQTELPRREWFVWFLDATKQGLGSSFGHFANIFLSVVIADSIVGADECQWYCLNYVVDCTLGTVLNLTFLSLFEKLVQHYQFATEYLNFGEYGDPPSIKIYMLQLSIWLLFVVLGKCIILFVLMQVITPLDEAISIIFSVFRGHPDLELVTVMIIIPSILNSIQFWVTDTFLKKQDSSSTSSRSVSIETRSSGKYKHNRISSSDSDTDLDEELISNNCNLGGSPTVNVGYKSLNISKSKSKDKDTSFRQSNASTSNRNNSSPAGKKGPSSSSSSGSSYIPDPTKIINTSTKLYVLPPASYVAKLYKNSTSNIPNVWGYFFPDSAQDSTKGSRSGSRHSSNDNLQGEEEEEECEDDERDGSSEISPTSSNPLMHNMKTSGYTPVSSSTHSDLKPSSSSLAYKKNDSFNSANNVFGSTNNNNNNSINKETGKSVMNSRMASSPVSVNNSTSGGGYLKQRKDFVGDVESTNYI